MMSNQPPTTALIVGLARQGLALARYLHQQGVILRVTDARPAEALQETIAQLADLPIAYTLGEHPLSLLEGVDVVYVSGGVPLDIPLLEAARERGLTLTNDSALFLAEAPCRVLGITGSSGKTTTTTLVGDIAKLAAQTAEWHAWMGGNIGNPLLNDLANLQPDDLAIVELSSFQLELMTTSPQIAAVLNITPNHLDRHKTMAAYIDAKANLVQFQTADDIAVLGWDDPTARGLAWQTSAQVWGFGFESPDSVMNGAWREGDTLTLRNDDQTTSIVTVDEVQLRGEHNLQNVLAAIALSAAAGLPISAMQSAIRSFRGVAHRLQLVREWQNISFINDSIGTSPERALAAIHAFDEPLVMLLGGRDKHLPWNDLAEAVHERARHAIVFGEAADLIVEALDNAAAHSETTTQVTQCNTLPEALKSAVKAALPGDVVLLSPGGTSFDAYPDFAARGNHFIELVQALPA